MNVKRAVGQAVFCAVVTISAVAGAVDTKNYAGATCQPVGGAISYDTIGRILNPSTAVVASTICPIVRDDASGAGASWTAANMSVIDQNPAQGFSCSATSRTPNGAGGFFSNASTGAAFVGTATIPFAALGKFPGGYYAISCRVPVRTAAGASSFLSSYRVTEPNPVEP